MPIRTLIVDDEFLARERLKKLLKEFPDVLVLGECRNGDEALAMVPLKTPDLIFLDIQMPGKSGLEVVEGLQRSGLKLPIIVFTTAYDQYALNAFEAEAIDYLLKPFEKGRFQQAVTRVQAQYKLRQSLDLNKKMMNLMKAFSPESSDYRDRFEMQEKGHDYIIRTDEILYILAEGNYLQLVTFSKKWLYRGTLNQIVQELNPKDFLRIHRSTVLNLCYLDAHQYKGNNEYKFKMKDGNSLVSARSYKHAISEHFSQ